MYRCLVPPRVFLAVGVGLLIFSLVLGWISFSVPDWLQFYERNNGRSSTFTNSSQMSDDFTDLKKFGLWYKCTFSPISNDFICTLWNNDTPSFVRVAQVLIPFGLSLGCLAFLCGIVGFMTRRAFITTVLFAALFAFLSFTFTTIGISVFATESVAYVRRLHIKNSEQSRRWGMWLIFPNIGLSFLSSICFILASITHWCDYRSMQVTGILSHSVDKYGGSVCKAPSDSNMTSGMKKQHSYVQQQFPGQDYPNTCYQLNGSNNNHNNPNPLNYPPPPSYGAPQGNPGGQNSAFQTSSGLFGYSRPASPNSYPHSGLDPYHPRHYMTENSEMEDLSRASRSRRHSHSRRHSSHRSRSRSPRESSAGGNIQDSAPKQPQFIPIPVPYYQPPAPPAQTAPQPSNVQVPNFTSNTASNTQPISYVIQAPKQQFIEELIQPASKPANMVTYGVNQPSLVMSKPTPPVYTIAYRTTNPANLLASNILTGAAATTYVTAARNIETEINSSNGESDQEEKEYRTTTKRRKLKTINTHEAWTWRKL